MTPTAHEILRPGDRVCLGFLEDSGKIDVPYHPLDQRALLASDEECVAVTTTGDQYTVYESTTMSWPGQPVGVREVAGL